MSTAAQRWNQQIQIESKQQKRIVDNTNATQKLSVSNFFVDHNDIESLKTFDDEHHQWEVDESRDFCRTILSILKE